jgi:hypothetical protein
VRRQLLRVFLFLTVVAAAAALSIRHVPALTDDFIAYWSAARVLAQGGNPYDLPALLSIHRAAGWPHDAPLPTWYGPWVVAATAPIGVVPYWPARIVWIALQVVCVWTSASLLWRLYGGAANSPRPYLLAAMFTPTLLCFFEGQITPMILLGLTGFLVLVTQHRDWQAGAALFPATAKPLTLYLVWLAIAMWTLRSRRPKVLLALALAVGVGACGALVLNTDVFGAWLRFAAARSPLGQAYTPTIGSILRAVFGKEYLWLAYPSMVIGLGWWLMTWRRYAATLDWRGELPMLSFVSLLTTPFGWSHDARLLLPAIIRHEAGADESPRRAQLWLLVNAVALALYPLLRYRQTWYLLYLVALFPWVKPPRDAVETDSRAAVSPRV